MTRKLISVAAIAFVILALAAVLYILNNAPVEEEEDYSSVSQIEIHYALGSEDSKRIKSIDVQNASGSFRINADNADATKTTDIVYSIEGLEKQPADKALFTLIASSAIRIQATSLVSENAPDLAIYGFDKPDARVKIAYTDGSEEELLIGINAPGGAGVYAKTAKNDNVYLVSQSSVEKFYYSKFDFFSKQVTDGSYEETDIAKATLSGSVRAEPIIMEKVEADPEAEYAFTTHVITQPVEIDLNTDQGLRMLRTVFGISADKVVGLADTDEKKEEYGLLEPYSVMSVETPFDENGNRLKFTVSAAKPDSSGMVNVMNDSSDLVYSVFAEDLDWLDAQIFDIMNRIVVLPHIDNVKTITIKTVDSSTVFNLEGEGDELVATVGDQVLDSDNFRRFYQSVISARYDSVPKEPLPENAPFALSYTYEYKDGSKSDVVTFHQGPARNYYVDLNGGESFLTVSSYADKVLEDISKLLAGGTIKPYL